MPTHSAFPRLQCDGRAWRHRVTRCLRWLAGHARGRAPGRVAQEVAGLFLAGRGVPLAGSACVSALLATRSQQMGW